MISVKVDEELLKEMVKQEIKEKLKKADRELIFFDFKELKRLTCLSENTIRTTFFYEPDFPKYKVGGKWLFPANETREYLLNWLSKQPRY